MNRPASLVHQGKPAAPTTVDASVEREATLYNLESDLADLCDAFLRAHYNDEHATPAIDNLRVAIAAWEQAGGGA